MPYFESNPLENLQIASSDAEETLDLGGLGLEPALQQLDSLLEAQGPAASYAVIFNGARNDGQETLFQPIGRHLLQARKDGRIAKLFPITDGTGYFLAFR